MPWGNRRSPDDSGARNEYGTELCPRCGKPITTNARGRKSHISACLRRDVVVRGKVFKAVGREGHEKESGRTGER